MRELIVPVEAAKKINNPYPFSLPLPLFLAHSCFTLNLICQSKRTPEASIKALVETTPAAVLMRGAFALYQAVIFCKVDARVKDFWAIFHQVCVCVCV